jgi:hypothetical protein
LSRHSRIKLLSGALLALVLLLVCALPGGAAAAGTGGISGTVTSAATGDPLEEVEVCAESTHEAFRCAESEAGGTYEITMLPADEYVVEFFPFSSSYAPQWWKESETRSGATAVVVAEGVTTTGTDAALIASASISGTITAAATGAPVREVEACATDGTLEKCAEANSRGEYTIGGLTAGSWELYFEVFGTGQNVISQPYAGGLVTLTKGQAKTGVNAALVAGGAIGGTVRLAATGKPLAGVKVCITEASELFTLGCITSPASGGYRFTGLWHTAFKIVFSPEASELFDPAFMQSGAKYVTVPDAYPTLWWNSKPTFATADPIAVTPPGVILGIDGSVGPPPVVPTPPATVLPVPPPPVKKKAVLICHKGFAKKKVHGKQRCVKRKAVHHRRKHAKPRRR